MPLPVTAYEACERRSTRASSQALVRYETNDYSVPVEYGGRREYVQVLRLLETFPLGEVSAAIRQAQLLQAISFDAVKHLLLCAIEERPPKLDLENYPYLPVAQVALTRAADYQALMPAGGQ